MDENISVILLREMLETAYMTIVVPKSRTPSNQSDFRKVRKAIILSLIIRDYYRGSAYEYQEYI